MTVTSPDSAETTVAPKRDKVLVAAVDLARTSLEEVAEPGSVGAYRGMEPIGERLAMHWFECLAPGYRGWAWGVSVARVPRGTVATVCETNLLPGPESMLAPEWLPYAERLAPGDLRAGDVLPYRGYDPNLEQGFEATGDEDVDQMGFFELGLGRPRVLSAVGRQVAADRWYAGDGGPTSDVAVKATERCSTCGYFLPMAGALRATFGVCANEWSPSDSRVVSLDHGCGAHSETDMEQPDPLHVGGPIVDEFAVDLEKGRSAHSTVEDAEQSPDRGLSTVEGSERSGEGSEQDEQGPGSDQDEQSPDRGLSTVEGSERSGEGEQVD